MSRGRIVGAFDPGEPVGAVHALMDQYAAAGYEVAMERSWTGRTIVKAYPKGARADRLAEEGVAA